jgi:hypothetical protein
MAPDLAAKTCGSLGGKALRPGAVSSGRSVRTREQGNTGNNSRRPSQQRGHEHALPFSTMGTRFSGLAAPERIYFYQCREHPVP